MSVRLISTRSKYVNMADLTAPIATDPMADPEERPGRESEPAWDIIELLFFAYRDFVSDPDEVLAKFGFGRAHHRVLHFVNRNPGMKVAELLDILKITKQSLGRVLKQLVDQGYVLQKEGANDRRQRLLTSPPRVRRWRCGSLACRPGGSTTPWASSAPMPTMRPAGSWRP